MSEDVREVYLVGYMVTEDEGSWPEIVTPERLARAVEAFNDSPCCYRHEHGAPGCYTESYPCKACQREGLLAALAVLAGRSA